ncbi:Serine/threonine-protein kinase PrkC [Streptomyces sp. YIM 130001]|uniref:serine/threonine-protein kinase n=1 Tax=Streptomyces sp. YIM 130001 TaxID=2259644 RepID=UPI000ED4D57F|nr:serine/threonine-protein kinase [Streptomyces sp. YIM 130001]RII20842.1 Serine/threonine-protein kinase PrkC [Streptomyces sp. YIM 130001]
MNETVFAGRYVLADEIGRGAAGAVWRTWDLRRQRYVAAKVLQRQAAGDLLRFVREQSMRIEHPHVLAPTSWAADDDQVLITMDLADGGSLEDLIGDYGQLPPPLVCTLLDQLLSGLEAVHAEQILHRDIKPANILLDATGLGTPRVRLSDFGLSLRRGDPRLTENHQVVGTPGYIAPELFEGDDPHIAGDLFAVGVVALYLLQGVEPDARALVRELESASVAPEAPAGIDEPLWQAVLMLLQPDRRARARSAAAAREAIARAAARLPAAVASDAEPIEVFDQLGPLPEGFGPSGPLTDDPSDAGTGAPNASMPGVSDSAATGGTAGSSGAGRIGATPGTSAEATAGAAPGTAPGTPQGSTVDAPTGSMAGTTPGTSAGAAPHAPAGSSTGTTPGTPARPASTGTTPATAPDAPADSATGTTSGTAAGRPPGTRAGIPAGAPSGPVPATPAGSPAGATPRGPDPRTATPDPSRTTPPGPAGPPASQEPEVTSYHLAPPASGPDTAHSPYPAAPGASAPGTPPPFPHVPEGIDPGGGPHTTRPDSRATPPGPDRPQRAPGTTGRLWLLALITCSLAAALWALVLIVG